jgi:hypothetical protein
MNLLTWNLNHRAARHRIMYGTGNQASLTQSALRVAENEFDLRTTGATSEQVDHAGRFLSGQAGAPGGRQRFELVARGQPRKLTRHAEGQQPQPQIFLALRRQSFQESQAATDPAFMAAEQFGRFELR